MSEPFDDDRPQPSPQEGVRILGAQEARAALEQDGRPLPPLVGSAAPNNDSPDGDHLDDGADATEEDAEEAAARRAAEHATFWGDDAPAAPPRFPEEGPTWSASMVGDDDTGPPSGEVPPLQHWTEPATGAIPAIFAEDSATEAVDDDAESDAWATVSGTAPRFRAEGSDWAEADFAEGDLTDDTTKIGALAEPEATALDDDEEFGREIAARRARSRRAETPPPSADDLIPGVTVAAAGASGAAAGTAAATAAETPAAPPRGPRRVTPPRPRRPEVAPPAEATPPVPARDLPTAIVTAAVVAVVALLCFSQGPAWTNVLVAAVLGLASLEFSAGLRAKGFRPAAPLALVGTMAMPFAAREYGPDAYPVFFAVVAVFSFLWFLLEVTPGRPLAGVATTVMAFAYIGGLGGFAGMLLASRDGVGLILGVVICVIAYDVFGFFIGSQFGHSPVAPRVSPNKTVEGTIGGMFASVLAGWLIVGGGIFSGIFPWTAGRGAVLGILVAVGAFLGDLGESMLKRDLGIKDFGALLPGHGGVLDRFDALLFCLPITYYLVLHFNIG